MNILYFFHFSKNADYFLPSNLIFSSFKGVLFFLKMKTRAKLLLILIKLKQCIKEAVLLRFSFNIDICNEKTYIRISVQTS